MSVLLSSPSEWQPMRVDLLRCDCGSGAQVFAVVPGQDAVYAVARNFLGIPDKRLGSIMVARPVADRGICGVCWKRRYAQPASVGATGKGTVTIRTVPDS
jgi:hypothetical protein